MVRRDAIFEAGEDLTPDVAARLATVAERYRAKLTMECGGRQALLDSLIGILSVECPRGTRVTVIAEGEDEEPAAEAMAAAMEGRQG